jgi:hypothetical protein
MAKSLYIVIAAIALALIFVGAYYGSKTTAVLTPEDKIKENLIEMTLTYSNIAGQPLTFTITADDIKSIEKTTLDGNAAWKVRVGDALAWDIYFDESGEQIIKKEQLFVS